MAKGVGVVLTLIAVVGCTGFNPVKTTTGESRLSPSPSPSPSPDPTPTGYEGFGAVTRGAEDCAGYQTVRVTNLNDSGTGSLRAAVSAGCRKIVFDVGGEIRLQTSLNIRHSYITIDGASAPTPGITLVHTSNAVGVSIISSNSIGPVHDVIVSHIRNVGPGGHDDSTADMWGIDGEAHPIHNIILDHITASGANDGVFDLYGPVTDVTISWNLITDTVTASHSAYEGTVRERISYHHNVFARNNERQVRIKYDTRMDFVNNIIYGWGWIECAARGLNIDTGDVDDPTLNVVNNLFHYVSGLPCGTPNDAIVFSTNGTDQANVYFAGNIVPSGETDAVSTGAEMTIPIEARVTTYGASTLKDTVLPFVGTHYPTAEETQLINQIRNDL